MTPPLRFLAGVIGGWCLLRATMLWWPLEQVGASGQLPPAGSRSEPGAPVLSSAAVAAASPVSTVAPHRGLAVSTSAADLTGPWIVAAAQPGPRATIRPAFTPSFEPLAMMVTPQSSFEARHVVVVSTAPGTGVAVAPASVDPAALAPALSLRASSERLHVTSWALWRSGNPGTATLTPGTLGGAQAGMRATYQLAPERLPGVALSARLSSPLRRSGAEGALGIEWQPSAKLPVRFLAERRQRISGEGRSAFALLAHGGVSDLPVTRGLSVDAYGAAGVVGARRRGLFAEGSATITRALGPVQVGAGAWGGTQPGVSRLDLGPTVQLPLVLGPTRTRMSLDYRLRAAGDASPPSGPTLTIGADF